MNQHEETERKRNFIPPGILNTGVYRRSGKLHGLLAKLAKRIKLDGDN